jgi:ubiquinol-cytochrome c reductase cytochrome c subunit
VASFVGVVALTLTVLYLMVPAMDGGAVRPRRSVQSVFLSDCAICHGADGQGSTKGPSLAQVGAAGVDFWVSTGRMPLADPNDTPERGPVRYSPARVRELVDYITGLTGNRVPEIPHVDVHGADLADGATQYQLNCAACHAATGVGGALFHREAPKVTDATARQAAEAMRIGPGQMPAFGQAALNRRQLDDTAAYVRYLDDPDDRGGDPLWHLGPLAEGAAVAVLALGSLLLAVRWIGTRR